MTDAIYSQPKLARGTRQAGAARPGRYARRLADSIAFLLSADASYITGQSLIVDGGLTRSILNHVPGIAATPAAKTPASKTK